MIYSKSISVHPAQDHVLGILTDSEPLSAQQLAGYAQVSQPTVSRAISGLGERIHRIGSARHTRYALKKDILGLSASHELLWNGPDLDGQMPTHFGRITFLHGDWLHVQTSGREWLLKDRLPWFLSSLQPKGFLGRALARARPDLPSDPAKWSLAQILHVAITHTHDPIGAFFINGIETKNCAAPPKEDPLALGAHFDLLAERVEQEQGMLAETSAGGEQPKFTTSQRDGKKFIVKFTKPQSSSFKSPGSDRWRALLMLEHLALNTLSAQGVPCADSQIIHTERRSYLQSQRFDRSSRDSGHAMRHIVSLEAVHSEFLNTAWQSWTQTCEALFQKGLLSEGQVKDVARIEAFGRYILNTDRHWGNFSFYVDDVFSPRISPAPVYDMLPMWWQPRDMVDSPIQEEPRIPKGYEQEYAQARAWAIEFWERAARLDIGADLQAASRESARRLKTNFADL